MNTQIAIKVIELLQNLPYDSQLQVLEFTRALALSAPRGIAGIQLLRFAGTISHSDVGLMREAIQKGCEQVDTDEW